MTLTNPHDCLQIELFLDENDTTSFNRKQRELQRRGMYESSLRSCLVPELVSSDVWQAYVSDRETGNGPIPGKNALKRAQTGNFLQPGKNALK